MQFSWTQWISLSPICIYSIYCHVLFKCTYYKMGQGQALQIAKEVALWADFSVNCITHDLLLLPTFIYRAFWYQALL